MTENRASSTWVPQFLALALIWGSSFLFIKVAVTELHPFYVAAYRVALGALVLLAIVLITRDRLPRDPRLWGHLAVTAALGNSAPFVLFAYGEQEVSSGLAGIWNATTPLTMTLVLIAVFRMERPTRARILGLLVGFAGVLVVIGAWTDISGSLLGQITCFAAATCYAFSAPYQRKYVAARPESGVSLACGQLLMATLQLAVLAPFIAGKPDLDLGVKPALAIIALGAVGTGIAFVLNYHVIRIVGAATMGTVTYLMPIVAIAMGVVVLGEHIEWYQPVGALVILAGVAIAQGIPARLAARRKQAPAQIGVTKNGEDVAVPREDLVRAG